MRAALRGSPRSRTRAARGDRARRGRPGGRPAGTTAAPPRTHSRPGRAGSRRRAGPARRSRRRRARTRAIPRSAGTRFRRAGRRRCARDRPTRRSRTARGDDDAALALRSLREYWLMPLVTTARARRRRDHRAARAHAEAVARAPVRAWWTSCSRRRQEGWPAAAPWRAVDQRLRMLDRKPIENGFVEWTPRACSIAGVARAVAGCDDACVASISRARSAASASPPLTRLAALLDDDAAHRASFDREVDEARRRSRRRALISRRRGAVTTPTRRRY